MNKKNWNASRFKISNREEIKFESAIAIFNLTRETEREGGREQ